jgi:GTP-binding protein
MLEATEFYSLGFDKVFFVSSISGSGTGELLDEVTAQIPEDAEMANPNVKRTLKRQKAQRSDADLEKEWEEGDEYDEDEEEIYTENYEEIDEENKIIEFDEYVPKIAIIGQPNAGKSTLLNALTGEERTIVSNIPGTTRDSIHTHYKLFGKEFILIDTAGLRKKKNVHEDLEFYSVIRAIRAMDEADICLLVIDALNGITMQDINIFSLAARKGKGILILVNKWDAFEKETNTARDYEQKIKQKITFIIRISFVIAISVRLIFMS